ncbi:MAG: Gfo/Idh/MocA family oxidoreductase [Kofleriaceae bacterium]|nr:Gfo/Idh/MocA family oxidoreductase [Kofleriaceae bacterium]
MAFSRRDFLHLGALGATTWLAAEAAPAQPIAPPDNQSADAKLPEVVKRKLGLAIVGLGKLALEEVLPAFGEAKYVLPVALVSGHPDKARRVAQTFGVPSNAIYDYAGFDKIASNPAIDAVYIILPNSMHAEYTIRALRGGKHVLCEKPMATSVQEGEQMIAAAAKAKRQLAIAYRLQYEPTHLRAIEICRKQELGALKIIRATNCQDTKAPNIRLAKALGGGPLQDVGIYCINAVRYLTSEMPVEVTAFAHHSKEPRFAEVPESVVFSLRFPSGILAQGSCSLGSAESRHLEVIARGGSFSIDNAFAYRDLEMKIRRAAEPGGRPREEIFPVVDQQNQFALEMDAFAQAILASKPVRTPGSDGLADLRVIAAIEEAARTSRAVKV